MIKKERLERIQKLLADKAIDQMMICDPSAIFYVTGKWIHPGERFLGLYLQRGKEPVLFLNELFYFAEEIGAKKVYFSDTDDIAAVWKREVDSTKVLGIDKSMTAGFLIRMMENKVAAGYVNGSPAIDTARARKDAAEQALMREASRINDAAMAQFKTLIHAGVTEKEVAAQIEKIYISLGAQGNSFEPIVGFGSNAADPHHMPDDTVLREGDGVLFDVGCIKDDYCSDMTRTFFYKKEPNEEQKGIYEITRRANEAAEEILRPGIRLCDVDRTARDIIAAEGFGPCFTHRLGHFIGIEVHEFGDVSSANENLTEVGNTFSIEPGIYVKNGVGVRIEDLALITENGHEILNHYPHEIEVIED